MAECLDAVALSDIAKKDTQRLVGSVAKALAANSVFINVLDGGIFESAVSDEQRTTVQMPAGHGDSLAVPTFINDTEVCGTIGEQDLTDTIDYIYRLQTKRGYGPRICVKQGYSAFRSSYVAAEDSLRKLITQYVNADIRAQLLLKSASKFVAAAGFCFDELFTGGEFNDVGVQFANQLPTGPVTFKTIHYLARHLKEVLWADMFPASGKAMEHFRVIGSADIIESFRAEIGVENVLIALTEGGYKLGETALTAYSFESSPAYRGIAFGVDQTPLRASGFDGNGDLVLIDPRLRVVNGTKAYSVPNPAWLNAEYEILFIVAPGTFKRLVPQKYVGEGSFRFAPQLHMGELEWHYSKDSCNPFGDFGNHIYQITRAYQPVRPHHIVPVLYKRCKPDLGLEDCVLTTCESISEV